MQRRHSWEKRKETLKPWRKRWVKRWTLKCFCSWHFFLRFCRMFSFFSPLFIICSKFHWLSRLRIPLIQISWILSLNRNILTFDCSICCCWKYFKAFLRSCAGFSYSLQKRLAIYASLFDVDVLLFLSSCALYQGFKHSTVVYNQMFSVRVFEVCVRIGISTDI